MRLPLLLRLTLLVTLVMIAASCAGPVGSATPLPPTTAIPTAVTTRAQPDSASVPPTSYPAPPLPTSYPAPAFPTSYPAPASGDQTPPTITSGPSVAQPAQTGPEYLRCKVVNTYAHDAGAWTQGLIYIGNDSFYESTGLNGYSSLREVGLDGVVRRQANLDTFTPGQSLFGEGIALVGDRIFQITWRDGRGFIYNRADFQIVGQFSYPATAGGMPQEGWGLTYDGQRIIMSDGSSTLYFVDPAATASSGTLAVTGQVQVTDRGQPVPQLNELEYINGEVWANVWLTDAIARIDPASGEVKAWIDCSGLLSASDRQFYPVDVLNGIAYDPASDRLFVTGKRWPKLFEIDLALPQSSIVNMPLLGL